MENSEFEFRRTDDRVLEDPGNKELLVMTIEIGDGRQDTIAIHELDDPIMLAKAFSDKHGLDVSLQNSLVTLIQENKEMIKKKDLNVPPDGPSIDWMASNSMSPTQNYKKKSKHPKAPKKGTVYDRIYQQLKKNNTSASFQTASELNKSKSISSFNYGEYLYARGLKKKEELKKNAELKQQALVDSELPDLTFSPSINKNTSVISPRNSDKPEEILLKKAQEYQEKLERLKNAVDQETMKECKFTPTINPSSYKSRDSAKNIHEQLFSLSDKLKEKQLKKAENEIKQYSFKPDVKLTKKKGVKETKEEVFDRLDASKKISEENLERQRKEKQEMEFDEVTGQKLFKPLINSCTETRNKGTAIWDFLYSRNDTKKKELQELQSEQHKMVDIATTTKKSSENSEKIFHDFRLRQYERIFKTLDSDGDGVISATAIQIKDIDISALKILAPFFEELEESKETLDFSQFSGKMDILIKSLNVAQRSQLLKKENKVEALEPERKPFISPNSLLLAEKKRSTLPTDIYDRLTAANKMTEMRVQKIKEEKEKDHVKECTFKPVLKTN